MTDTFDWTLPLISAAGRIDCSVHYKGDFDHRGDAPYGFCPGYVYFWNVGKNAENTIGT